MFLLDVDRLDEALVGLSPLAAVDRPALLAFRQSDHMINRRPDTSLADAVRNLVVERTGVRPTGQILLLTSLAYFGYSFNPVSFYYVFDAESPSRVDCIVAEVTNTPWSEQHCYVLTARNPSVLALTCDSGGVTRPGWDDAWVRAGSSPSTATGDSTPASVPLNSAATGKLGAPWLRYCWWKDFHVSPFMPMNQAYDWMFSLPGDEIRMYSRNLQIPTEEEAPGPVPSGGEGLIVSPRRPPSLSVGACVFTTQLHLQRVPMPRMTAWTVLWLLFAAFPLLSYRVQLWIHLEAIRLWRKGTALHAHPTGATTAFTRAVAFIAGLVLPMFSVWAWLRAALGVGARRKLAP